MCELCSCLTKNSIQDRFEDLGKLIILFKK